MILLCDRRTDCWAAVDITFVCIFIGFHPGPSFSSHAFLEASCVTLGYLSRRIGEGGKRYGADLHICKEWWTDAWDVIKTRREVGSRDLSRAAASRVCASYRNPIAILCASRGVCITKMVVCRPHSYDACVKCRTRVCEGMHAKGVGGLCAPIGRVVSERVGRRRSSGCLLVGRLYIHIPSNQ